MAIIVPSRVATLGKSFSCQLITQARWRNLATRFACPQSSRKTRHQADTSDRVIEMVSLQRGNFIGWDTALMLPRDFALMSVFPLWLDAKDGLSRRSVLKLRPCFEISSTWNFDRSQQPESNQSISVCGTPQKLVKFPPLCLLSIGSIARKVQINHLIWQILYL